MNILKTVEEAIYYAFTHLELHEQDVIYFRNILLGELNLTEPYNGDIDKEYIKSLTVPDEIVNSLNDYLINEKKMDEAEANRFVTKLMGLLSPLPSQVQNHFEEEEKKNDFAALNYLYRLSIYNDYVQKTKVDKNIIWLAKEDNSSRYLEISINLSKPEKNSKDIKKLLNKTVTTYPKCLLCKENVGFYGNEKHPARENIRVIKMDLGSDKWYLQYSPYGYYNMHCIVFNDKHDFMKIDESSIKALLDFVDRFPSFFLGSNAELPIVGGSILNHGHFQGGEHLLPVMKMNNKKEFALPNSFKSTKLYEVDWYNTVLLLRGKDKDEIVKAFDLILSTWRNYDDEKEGIIHESQGERHNTLNPIVRKVGDEYLVYLILRNNQVSEEYPDGIYHAHPEYHHIKKENIGLIEAMGLFILPARLVRQFNEIKEVVSHNLSYKDAFSKYNDLVDFKPMIDYLRGKNNLDDEVIQYVNNVCRNILDNTAVFKKDQKGQNALDIFIKHLGK